MEYYLYLSLIPESLIVSMLPPEEFGNYLAVGTKKRTRGEAMFFELDPNFKNSFFPFSDIDKRCVPHSDGRSKQSIYLSIYRVLENIPLNVLKSLYLVTDDGRVLEISKSKYTPNNEDELHLYQELSPVTPLIVSRLNPLEFCRFVTDRKNPVSVPKLAFVELILDDMDKNPESAHEHNLPYPNIDHLMDCLSELKKQSGKTTKTVIRSMQRDLLYRTIKNGIFVGDQKELYFYPFPSRKDLENKFYAWWRSALVIGFGR